MSRYAIYEMRIFYIPTIYRYISRHLILISAIVISRIQLYDSRLAKRNVTNEWIRIIGNYIGFNNGWH